ncbi:YceI family protein [Winogradskyella flava]|uniref:YceI family protein n=1 Tax=Winogradskyella flava TaxID=1884876 RepID=UPI0024932EC8|nr:YceI family protein [Winogradskyella flava]
MKIRFVVAFLVCLSLTGFAQKSSVDFEIKNVGITVDGHFNTFVINVELGSNAELKTISGKITASSIETGIDSRDEHLLEEDYFHVEKHKYITLKSTSITKTSPSKYSVKATLSIKGKTKNITIPVMIQKVDGGHKFTSDFEINRRDFDVGGGSFVMSKTVKIYVTHYQKL